MISLILRAVPIQFEVLRDGWMDGHLQAWIKAFVHKAPDAVDVLARDAHVFE